MEKILDFMFVLILLTSCQHNTPKTTIIADDFENELKETKANVIFSGGVNNGICINCSQ